MQANLLCLFCFIMHLTHSLLLLCTSCCGRLAANATCHAEAPLTSLLHNLECIAALHTFMYVCAAAVYATKSCLHRWCLQRTLCTVHAAVAGQPQPPSYCTHTAAAAAVIILTQYTCTNDLPFPPQLLYLAAAFQLLVCC